jgi:hypothetical protein
LLSIYVGLKGNYVWVVVNYGEKERGRSMKLFHFSEESSIEIFEPRVKENRTDMPPVVEWYERIKSTTIYRYRLPADTFQLFDEVAGYYISTQAVIPIEVEPLDNLIDRLINLKIELRFTPNLYPLRNAILNSSIKDFAIHRFANAKI